MHCKLRAMYDRPTEQPATFFCEACAISLPADDKQWRMHAASEAHLLQLDSLQYYGRLGHMPGEGHKKLLAANLEQTYTSHQAPSVVAEGSGLLNQDPTLSEEQLQHFGCKDCGKILGLQLSLLQANILKPPSNNAMASELAVLTHTAALPIGVILYSRCTLCSISPRMIGST